jgi:hypothetical protein
VPAELLQWNSTILTFHINRYCPRAHYGSDHSISIVQYHYPKPNIFTGTRNHDSFGFVNFAPVIFPPKQTILFLVPFLYCAYLPSYRKYPHRDWNPRHISGLWPFSSNVVETNKFGPGAVLPSCSFRATEITLTGTINKDTFEVLTFLKSLPSFKAFQVRL